MLPVAYFLHRYTPYTSGRIYDPYIRVLCTGLYGAVFRRAWTAGMHGAGLTHALFLRSTSALIELFPSYWSPAEHFAAIAGWRRLVYLRWVNNDLTAERPDGRSTAVPPSVVAALVRTAVRRLCPHHAGADVASSPSAASLSHDVDAPLTRASQQPTR